MRSITSPRDGVRETFRAVTDSAAQARGKDAAAVLAGSGGSVPFDGDDWLSRRRDNVGYAASLLKVFLPYLVWNTVFDNTRVVARTGSRARAVFLLLLFRCCASRERTLPLSLPRLAGGDFSNRTR